MWPDSGLQSAMTILLAGQAHVLAVEASTPVRWSRSGSRSSRLRTEPATPAGTTPRSPGRYAAKVSPEPRRGIRYRA